jgi:hypothetical protein
MAQASFKTYKICPTFSRLNFYNCVTGAIEEHEGALEEFKSITFRGHTRGF